MNKRLAHLEHPAPKIALNATRFDVEGAGIAEGEFEVSNIGEAELAGKIASSSDILSFSPMEFFGAKTRVEYSLNLEGLSGQHKLSAIISSNGGEKMLNFDVKVNPPPLTTKDGARLATLEHFLEYARQKPVAARQIFGQKEFMIWLFNTGYSAMDIYEQMAADPNKERGLDNFLVFSGLKTKAALALEQKKITHNADRKEAITGGFVVRRSAWGFVEGNLIVNPEAHWLKLSKTKLTQADFDENNMAEVDYIIAPEEIGKPRGDTAKVTLYGESGQNIYIRCSLAAPFRAYLGREAYYFEDLGKLHLINNTGRDLMIDIQCESYVKFQAKRYFISKSAEIDFEIKFSNQKAASLILRKLLYVKSEILVSAIGGDGGVVRVPLTLWAIRN